MREKTVGARRNQNGGRAAQAGDAFHLREEQPLPPIAGKGLEFVAGKEGVKGFPRRIFSGKANETQRIPPPGLRDAAVLRRTGFPRG